MLYYRKLLLLVLFVGCCAVNAKLPENYDTLPNEQKQDILWEKISQSHSKNPFPEMSQGGFLEVLAKLRGLFNLRPTFDHASDEIPDKRVKIIHANGSVGKIYFMPAAGHPFTGIYQSGGIGLARLSVATTPSDTSFVPGMAIKILVLHHPSVNLQVMNRLEGQDGDWNYFANDFSNQIPHAKNLVLKAIEKIFEWTRKPANELPLSHLAALNDQGEQVLRPIAPDRLFFRPSDLVRNSIPATSRDDFRLSLSGINVGPIYEVYGVLQDVEYHVGTLMLESTLLASEYGDKKLFFQHQR